MTARLVPDSVLKSRSLLSLLTLRSFTSSRLIGALFLFNPPLLKTSRSLSTVSCFALKKGYVRYGDLVIVTAGSPFGVSGTTNMMLVQSIGDVLVRGRTRPGRRVHGKITIFMPRMKKDTDHCAIASS